MPGHTQNPQFQVQKQVTSSAGASRSGKHQPTAPSARPSPLTRTASPPLSQKEGTHNHGRWRMCVQTHSTGARRMCQWRLCGEGLRGFFVVGRRGATLLWLSRALHTLGIRRQVPRSSLQRSLDPPTIRRGLQRVASRARNGVRTVLGESDKFDKFETAWFVGGVYMSTWFCLVREILAKVNWPLNNLPCTERTSCCLCAYHHPPPSSTIQRHPPWASIPGPEFPQKECDLDVDVTRPDLGPDLGPAANATAAGCTTLFSPFPPPRRRQALKIRGKKG